MVLVYEPLASSLRQIRLLTLLPASSISDDSVSATLRPISLDENPAFEALSYVWGDEEDTIEIDVDGNVALVTKNLEAALRQLRSSTARVLWVDALCINQKDTDEKNHQVPLMSEIYTKCQQLVIWLGQGNKYIESFFQWISSMPLEESTNNGIPPTTTQPRRHDDVMAIVGYYEIFGLPYWQRMWTYQEMILPVNDPICVYGDYHSPVSVLLSPKLGNCVDEYCDPDLFGIELAKLGRFQNGSLYNYMKRKAFTISTVSSGRKKRSNLPLAYQLAMTAGRASKDPRDRIYALHGLCPILETIYPVDYGSHRRLDLVLTEVTEFIIQHENAMMDILGFLPLRSDRFSDTALPSWIPEYNGPVRRDRDLFICAQGLRQRSVNDAISETLRRDITVVLGLRGIGPERFREHMSAATKAAVKRSMEAIKGLPLYYVNGTKMVHFPRDLGEPDFREPPNAVGHEVQADKVEVSQSPLYRPLGHHPTLIVAARYIGTCYPLCTFGSVRDESIIALCRILSAARMYNDLKMVDMMLRLMMSTYPEDREKLPTFDVLRAALHVAICRDTSGRFKIENWINHAAQHATAEVTAPMAIEEGMLRIFYKFSEQTMEEFATKTLFAVEGLGLVGLGEEPFEDEDIVITPIAERSIPLVLRRVQSSDAEGPLGESQTQKVRQRKDGTVYYKLVGVAMICGLTEESGLVSRLAEQRAEDYLII